MLDENVLKYLFTNKCNVNKCNVNKLNTYSSDIYVMIACYKRPGDATQATWVKDNQYTIHCKERR